MIAIQELLKNVVNGEMDPFRKQIMEAFKVRDKNKNLLPLDRLTDGMKVKLTGCEKDLNGLTGTILFKMKDMVMVEITTKAGESKKISCIPGQLEVVK